MSLVAATSLPKRVVHELLAVKIPIASEFAFTKRQKTERCEYGVFCVLVNCGATSCFRRCRDVVPDFPTILAIDLIHHPSFRDRPVHPSLFGVATLLWWVR